MVLTEKLRSNLVRFIQIGLTIITFLVLVILPLLGYFQFISVDFSSCPDCEVNLEGFRLRIEFVTFMSISAGIIATIVRYVIFRCSKYSLRRKTLSLLYSAIFVFSISLSSLLDPLQIVSRNSEISLNMMGVFILLIFLSSLFFFKALYDLVDFRIHKRYYSNLGHIPKKNQHNSWNKNLIECSSCRYMCQVTWKSCPICHTRIWKKN